MTDLNPTKAERLHEWLKQTYVAPPLLKECQLFFDELDKPKLLPPHRAILRALMDGKGNVTKVDGKWHHFVIGNEGFINHAASITCSERIDTMIDLKLLYVDDDMCSHSGMTAAASVTDAGVTALEQ